MKFKLLILLLVPTLLFAVKTQVRLVAGGDKALRLTVEKNLTEVLNEVNRCHDGNGSLENIRQYFKPHAFRDLKTLINETKLYANQKEYRTYLIKTTNCFEVRNLKVRVFLGKTSGRPFQNLVFAIDKTGKIENVRFSVQKHHYETIVSQGKKLNDLAFREKILHFIEIYRTAYNKKDSVFIEKTLSDDALIIVGHVVKTKPQEVDYLAHSYLSNEKIEFIRLTKMEYLERLKKVFRKNDFVRVLFDQITIHRHPQFEKIYGVQLKQRWNSSTYSDEGYLFLMVDFIEPEAPIIHVRAWQPDKFADGSTINIYDFEIVE